MIRFRPLGAASALAATLALTTALVLADEPAPPPGAPPLPPEAYAACDSKADGDACTVTIRDHQIDGVCRPAPSDKRLFCLPKGLPPPRPSGS
jgi:hypothetical protein